MKTVMHKNIKAKVLRIIELALEISTIDQNAQLDDQTMVFVDFSPHVFNLTVRIYYGWVEGKSSDRSYDVYIDKNSENLNKCSLNKIISDLEELAEQVREAKK